MTTTSFSGVNLAIATPFTQSGEIDFARFESLIEAYLDAGVHGLVVSSGTGMHVYLTEAESAKLIETACRRVGGRTRIIAQTSALVPGEVVRRTHHARDCGADGVMVLPPFFEGPADEDGVVAFYAEVDAVGLPIIGYNVPAAVGVEITPSLYRRLCALPNFHGVKDSSGDMAAQQVLIRCAGGAILNGADPLALYALVAGVEGLVWGGANFAPRSCVALYESAAKGDWEGARQVWDRLAPAMSAIWGPDYVASVYACAAAMGYDAGAPRRPLSPLDPARLPVLREALKPLRGYDG